MGNPTFKTSLGTPRGVVSVIGMLILGGEFFIMVVIGILRPALGTHVSGLFWDLIDPFVLTVIVTPALYALVLRPLQNQQELLQRQYAELRIAAVTFDSQEGIIVTDANNTILKVNQTFTDLTGYTSAEAVGKTPSILKSGRQDEDFYRRMWDVLKRDKYWHGELWNRRKNGEVYPEWLAITAVIGAGGNVINYVGIFSDITERKVSEEKIRTLAFFDPLTQLPNRRLLLNRLDKALTTTSRNNSHGALMFMDLDHFKTINDIYGHEAGDMLLLEVAERISGCIREQDSASRFGGDEFVVMLEDLSEDAEHAALQAEGVAEKIHSALGQPYSLRRPSSVDTDDGIEHYCTPSIGVTMFHGREEVETLLKWADMAMYQAKSSGRNSIRFFDPVMQATIEKRADLETGLRLALDMRQLRLHYQLQVNSSLHPQGAEALLRWEHPQRGMVSPDEFIPLAEETGLILPVGDWVLDTACAQLKAWQNDPVMGNLQLAVNISAKQFRQHDFIERVVSAVGRHGVNPLLLKLELTESLILDDIEDTVQKMRTLKEQGVGFSLDDFGTGYSSLSYLKRLPLNQIKIDQSFVKNVTIDRGDMAMVQAIVDLGLNFELDVIAEGVETDEQFKLLKRYGCATFQGYWFGKPLPVEQFEQLVRKADCRVS